jgi:hypothetical protein
MTVIAQTTLASPRIPPFPVRRFSVAEYHRMIETDVLGEDDAVELLEGWIVPKMPRNPPHDATVDLVQEILKTHLGNDWRVRAQSAITLDDSEPEPDLAVAPGPAERYASRHPLATEVAMVVEVADSTLTRDRSIKRRLYARSMIPFYWIINLVDAQIEVHTDPSGQGEAADYRNREIYRAGQPVPLKVGQRPIENLQVSALLVRQ